MKDPAKVKMGRSNKRRGYYYEQRLVKLATAAGIAAVRMPLSGSVKGFEGDVRLNGGRVEVKSRKGGFSMDDILDPERGNDYLVTFTSFSGGRKREPILRMRLCDFFTLYKRARP